MSWTDILAGRGAISAIVKIEGIGHGLSGANLALTDGDGATKFYTVKPTYAAQADFLTDRAYLTEPPDIMAEEVEPLGGFPRLGEISFSITDVGDYLTDRIRTESEPVTWLAEDLTAAETSIDVEDGSVLTSTTPGNVAFIGSEAVLITGISTNTLTVTRGYLMTQAVTHATGAPVYLYPSFLRGRRVQVLWTPTDSTDGTGGDDVLMAEGIIDGVSFDPALNEWQFTARSELAYLERQVPRKSRGARILVSETFRGETRVRLDPINTFAADALIHWTGNEADDLVDWYGLVDGEVVGFQQSPSNDTYNLVTRRGCAHTKRTELFSETFGWDATPTLMTQVFVAERNPGSFRWSPGPTPATTRGSGTWNRSAHWVDIILTILTSSADEDDGLELQNYTSAGNWSTLPPGYGVGLPAADIDFDGWLDVKARTPGYDFPGFVFGHEPMSFADLLSRYFLKPLGAYVSSDAGTAKLVLPRVPVLGSAILTLGPEDLLGREVGRGIMEPRWSVSRDVSGHTGSIVYKRGQEPLLEIDSGDYAGTYGRRGFYGQDIKPVIIDVQGIDPEHPSTRHMLLSSGMRRLLRFHRPLWRIQGDVSLEHRASLTHGAVVGLTVADAPNLDGTRGWSGMLTEVISREHRMETGPEGGAFLSLGLLGYGQGLRVGQITPSAYVASAAAVRYGWSLNKPSEYTGGYSTYDEYVALNTTAYSDLGGANQTAFSVALVFSVDAMTNPEIHHLVCIASAATDREFVVRVTEAGVLQVMIKGAVKINTASGAIAEGTRYFLVVTYDGTLVDSTQRAKVWLAEIGTDSVVSDPITTRNATGADLDFDNGSSFYELGRRQAGPDGYAAATYELYGAWLSTLTEANANALYNGGSYIDCDAAGAPAGVLHWYSFGGNASDDPTTQLTDEAGGGANGTPANMEANDENPVSASGVVATLTNRYTQSDATGGLPVTDAAAFAVGDVLQRSSLAGVLAAGTETVTAVGSGTLTLSGDFSGSLAAGDVLVPAEWDSMASQQQADHAAFGDRASNGVDAGGGALWKYGEP